AGRVFARPATLAGIMRELDGRPGFTALIARGLVTMGLGGAPVLRPWLRRVFGHLPEVRIRTVYGMTEILPVAIADGAEKLRLAEAGVDGDPVGRPVRSVGARIDAGEPVPAGSGLARGYPAALPAHPPTA